MSRLLWVLAVAVSLAVIVVATGSSAVRSQAGTQFTITKTVIPIFVKQNGPKGTRAIYWQGNPTFPVTVNEKGICPESVNCGPRDARGFGTPVGKTVFTTRTNPLVTSNYYFCSGSLTSNYVIGVEYWLTDAKGHSTPISRNFWVCQTH